MEAATDLAPLLSAKEVARILGCDPAMVRILVAEGCLKLVRLGPRGWHRFRREDVEALIAGEKPHE